MEKLSLPKVLFESEDFKTLDHTQIEVLVGVINDLWDKSLMQAAANLKIAMQAAGIKDPESLFPELVSSKNALPEWYNTAFETLSTQVELRCLWD